MEIMEIISLLKCKNPGIVNSCKLTESIEEACNKHHDEQKELKEDRPLPQVIGGMSSEQNVNEVISTYPFKLIRPTAVTRCAFIPHRCFEAEVCRCRETSQSHYPSKKSVTNETLSYPDMVFMRYKPCMQSIYAHIHDTKHTQRK